jgi:hypothetical protein
VEPEHSATHAGERVPHEKNRKDNPGGYDAARVECHLAPPSPERSSPCSARLELSHEGAEVGLLLRIQLQAEHHLNVTGSS